MTSLISSTTFCDVIHFVNNVGWRFWFIYNAVGIQPAPFLFCQTSWRIWQLCMTSFVLMLVLFCVIGWRQPCGLPEELLPQIAVDCDCLISTYINFLEIHLEIKKPEICKKWKIGRNLMKNQMWILIVEMWKLKLLWSIHELYQGLLIPKLYENLRSKLLKDHYFEKLQKIRFSLWDPKFDCNLKIDIQLKSCLCMYLYLFVCNVNVL